MRVMSLLSWMLIREPRRSVHTFDSSGNSWRSTPIVRLFRSVSWPSLFSGSDKISNSYDWERKKMSHKTIRVKQFFFLLLCLCLMKLINIFSWYSWCDMVFSNVIVISISKLIVCCDSRQIISNFRIWI